MRLEVIICDNCDKQSKDVCGDIDWVKIESDSPMTFSMSNGRPNEPIDTTHKDKLWKKTYQRELNFCSLTCMLRWMGFSQVISEYVHKYQHVPLEENYTLAKEHQ